MKYFDRYLSFLAIALIGACALMIYLNEVPDPGPVKLPFTVSDGVHPNDIGGVNGVPFFDAWENTAGTPTFYAATMDGKVWACVRIPALECKHLWTDQLIIQLYKENYPAPLKPFPKRLEN